MPAEPPPPPQAARKAKAIQARAEIVRLSIDMFCIPEVRDPRLLQRAAERSVTIFGVMKISNSVLLTVRAVFLKRWPR